VITRKRNPTRPTNLVDDSEPFSVDNKERKNFIIFFLATKAPIISNWGNYLIFNKLAIATRHPACHSIA
jgi:hypothetical protein